MLRPLAITLTSMLLLGFVAPPANAQQTKTIVYVLDDVWLNPDIVNPRGLSRTQMTGTFSWTYTVGDFENGVGQFTEVYLPWYGSDLNDLAITIDTTSIEFSLIGNYHQFSYGLTLVLQAPLNETDPVAVDTVRSQFEYENGVITKGHADSGQVILDTYLSMNLRGSCPLYTAEINRATINGQVALLYAFGTGSQVIPNGYPCAGTVLGLDQTTKLGIVVTANAQGQVSQSVNLPSSMCGLVYLQALDLQSCRLSDVFLLN